MLTGLAALFPILITVFLLSWLYGQLDRTIGAQVNGALKRIAVKRPGVFRLFYPEAEPEEGRTADQRADYVKEKGEFPRYVGTSIGILGALILVYVLGVFLRGYIGSRIISSVDRFFERFPVIKAIYPHARQVGDFLFGSRSGPAFNHVVAVEYPRRGTYTVGFRTGSGLKDGQERSGEDLVAVLIPPSPTPVTGFVVLVPREEVIELDMSMEEAFRFFMTAGMVAGPGQRTEGAHRLVAKASCLPTDSETQTEKTKTEHAEGSSSASSSEGVSPDASPEETEADGNVS